MITMGGNAEIELIDSMDPFSEGELTRTDGDAELRLHRRRPFHHASEEVLEGYRESIWWREDVGISGLGLRTSRFQSQLSTV